MTNQTVRESQSPMPVTSDLLVLSSVEPNKLRCALFIHDCRTGVWSWMLYEYTGEGGSKALLHRRPASVLAGANLKHDVTLLGNRHETLAEGPKCAWSW